MALDKAKRRKKIKYRVRKKMHGTSERPRLSVFRSNSSLFVQLIDDDKSETLVSLSSTKVKKGKSTNMDLSKKVGVEFGKKVKEAGVSKVVFDRNGYLYHGKIKSLAEGVREAGIEF